MSIEETRQWIKAHARRHDSNARWDGALEDTRVCATEANRLVGTGFAKASAYYNCRKNKKLTKLGLFNVPTTGVAR